MRLNCRFLIPIHRYTIPSLDQRDVIDQFKEATSNHSAFCNGLSDEANEQQNVTQKRRKMVEKGPPAPWIFSITLR